jgi:ubiquinone biosynthesis protein
VAELAKLQDEVAPFPYEEVRQVIIDQLGAPPEELFDRFDPQPMAAASIGQVHRACLPGGRAVVVKVQRPGVEPQIQADVDIVRRVARLIQNHTTWGREFGVVEIAEEFARSLLDEIDYVNEGRNAERLRLNLASQPQVHVPTIYWELVTPHLLTMEEVSGVKIDDLEALDQAGIDRAALAGLFMRSMFQQSLVDGFFQADPHPANLLVNPENGVLNFIDLGMMGTLVEEHREQLGEMVVAALQRDSREIVRIALVIGTPVREVNELALRRDVDRILNRYLTAGLSDISFTAILGEVMSIINEHGIRLPSDLTLGAKALTQAEAIARTLDPEIKVIEVARAAAQQIIWRRWDPRTAMTHLARDTREMVRLAKALPQALERLLHQIESGAVQVRLDAPGWEGQVRHLSTIANRLTAGLILAGLAIGSAIAMGISPQQSWDFVPVLGVIGFSLSTTLGVVLVWNVLLDIWRTDRHRDN